METVVKHFSELTLDELYEILKLRAAVFVVEQNCAYQDLDEVDKDAYHVYIKDEGKLLAYLRVVDKNKRLDEVSVGRVISLKRRIGLGSKLLQIGLQTAKEKYGATVVKVGAQTYAKPFYEQAGFCQVSEEYEEDGIPHIYMLYTEKA
ncbi:MAG: GNAT family N-acetyltransferase [Clostridia bacterium]|nr:GNAT family N-acetyltransferase [Clostridia bacterium]